VADSLVSVDDEFDDSDKVPSVDAANDELIRIATVRGEAAFASITQRLTATRDAALMLVIELTNWIGFLQELERKKGAR
jgi:hypothetical protein